MITIQVEINLQHVTCGECGLSFGLPDFYISNLRKSGKTFYCPNGHPRWYGPSEADKLKEELAKVEKIKTLYKQWYDEEVDSRKAVERSLSATKGGFDQDQTAHH